MCRVLTLFFMLTMYVIVDIRALIWLTFTSTNFFIKKKVLHGGEDSGDGVHGEHIGGHEGGGA